MDRWEHLIKAKQNNVEISAFIKIKQATSCPYDLHMTYKYAVRLQHFVCTINIAVPHPPDGKKCK